MLNRLAHKNPDTPELDGYCVRRYRPRIEGLFARIERWSKIGSHTDIHWRSISQGNILTLYGYDANSRIADPLDARRIFSWLICESRDDKGNGIRYLYKEEDGSYQFRPSQADPFQQAHQLNRGPASDPRRTAQRYLQRVLYGNRKPLLDAQGRRPRYLSDLPAPPTDTEADWLFEVRLDYGELDEDDPTANPEKPWRYRPDAFSSYRSGFEVRTCRRCERVLMLHHIPDQPAGPDRAAQPGYRGVVRSTEFTYDDELEPTIASQPVYSFLKRVTQTGWKQEEGSSTRRSLPPVEFEYSQPAVRDTIEEVDPESLQNLPVGLDGTAYRWVDLHSEGIPGILSEQAGAWFYKRNLSPLPIKLSDGSEWVKARFAPLETVALKPNIALSGGAEFMDLAGDGQPDVVVKDGAVPGLYEHDEAEGWQPFRPFTSRLNRDLRDPNLRFIDLDGDGHADVLITEDDALVWHASLAEEGFACARRVAMALDEEQGPRIVFADLTQSVYLADMSGDGLMDIVRISFGVEKREICYWPNLGYCRFGAKVTMDNAPCFDHPDQFDQKRVRLADIDGSGTTDIIYLHRDGVRLYFNQSGNAWSQAQTLKVFPRIDDLVSIAPIDLLGNGTACLVWSSPLPGDAQQPMRYVNLMGGRRSEPAVREEEQTQQKPHLLITVRNDLGAEIRIAYAPSTKFYLQDRRDGKPWITRLPFPVHVVERVEIHDHISRNRFVTRYAYHHGCFDGEEREFRGFGMVEQWDTEQFAAFADENVPATNIDAASHVPPVHTKTWFHTGVYPGRQHVSNYFAGLLDAVDQGEYFREPGLTDAQARDLLLPDTVLPHGLNIEEELEACRALKGSMLRQEIYADDADRPDATPEQIHRARTPYTITEQNFSILPLQRRGANRHAVFFTHTREAFSFHYERNPGDPRIQHALTLEVDRFGNVLKKAVIGYGRRVSPLLEQWDRDRQTTALMTCTETAVTNAVDDSTKHPDDYRSPQLSQLRNYELTGVARHDKRLGFNQVLDGMSAASPLNYEEEPTPGQNQKRLIEHVRTLYRKDDLSALLPLGKLEPLALPGESYKLAFTLGLLNQAFKRPRQGQADETLLPGATRATVLGGQAGDQGGYVDLDGDGCWWVPTGRSFYHPDDVAVPVELAEARAHFFLPRRYRDPFGKQTIVTFDGPADPVQPKYDLLMVEVCDALGNRVTVDLGDYRVLQPRRVSDPNRNQTEVAFDALGMVVATAVMGKPQVVPAEGDSLAGVVADITQAQLDGFFDAADPHTTAAALLQGATTRIVYDLDRFSRTRQANPGEPEKWLPACAATLVRETHVHSPMPPQGLKIQIGFSYSDGFGREIQKKIPAEPGTVPQRNERGDIIVGTDDQPVMTAADARPRWVGSGWTVFNNKGKPVRQYEPFFTDRHRFEFDVRIGVSPMLFYDPAGRIVATLHPNHTYEKVRFDPWQQTTWDVNDTCAPPTAKPGDPPPQETGDPRSDPDIGGYVAQYFKELPADPTKPWKTWHAQRIGGALDTDEQKAAQRAAAHADTPSTAHFDALGRPFITITRNRVVCNDHPLNGKSDEEFRNRVELDIEGNQRDVSDERKLPDAANLPLGPLEQRIVMRYAYDMLGNRIRQLSMEAGARWTLSDVAGKPIRAWDSRGHNLVTKYDALRRPTEQYVRGTFSNADPLKPNSDPRTLNPANVAGLLVDKIEYGEPPLNASLAQEMESQRLNLRTRIYRHFDSAGIATNARLDSNGQPTHAYDFKGNLLFSTRQLVSDYKAIPDWLQNPQLEAETFEASTRYDAVNRSIQSVAPRSSLGRGKFNVIQPIFNEANLLEQVHVWLERAAAPPGLLDPASEAPSPVGVANIDYDAKGQRTLIDYKTTDATVIRTSCAYERETFRLRHLYTRRGVDPGTAQGLTFTDDCENPDPPPPTTIAAPRTPPAGKGCGLRNLHYIYDPAGNITHTRDDAQQTIYFKNQRIEPSNDYVYDALYRLILAEGREHLGQAGAPIPHSYNDAGRVGILSASAAGGFAPYDSNAMGRYTERYIYDAVGNFFQMQHARHDDAMPNWVRHYAYAQASLIEPGKQSNRLSGAVVSGSPTEAYSHDAHGNMVGMPQLHTMRWDYQDQLQMTQRQKVNEQEMDGVARHGERTWYVYDASGQRVRKVTELTNNGGIKDERIYLGGFEVFRSYRGAANARTLDLERETLHITDDSQRIALVETRTLGDEQDIPRRLIRYQFGNHLGSSSLELDERAQIISYEEYAPYGSSTYQAVRSQTETAKRYRYTGKERDDESGLYYHGTRYYAAWLGRWTSYDPTGLGAGIDLYEYVSGNPVKLIDPDGNQECTMCDPKKTLGRQLLTALDEGIKAGDIEADVTARLLAGEFYERTRTGPGGAFEYHGNRRKIMDIGKKIGLTESESEELASMVRSFLPEDQPLTIDYAGRIGSEANLADRELADRLAVIGSQSTTFGSILASWTGAMGGNAEEMRRAGQAGDLIEGVAGGVAVVTNKQSRADRTQDRKTGSEEHPPAKASVPAEDVKPDVPTNALFRNRIKGPAIDSNSRGYDRRSKKHQQLLDRSLRWWGEPGPKPDKSELDLGHAGTPHVTLRPGQGGMLKAERSDVNQARGRTEEKALAKELRKRSAAAGLDPHDPANPFFTRPPKGR